MRTTLSIDDNLLRTAKSLARKEGVTLGAYVEEALRLRITEPAARPTTPVRLTTCSGGGIRPGIDPTSNRSMFDALDEEEFGL